MINFNVDKLQKDLDGKFNVAHLIVNRVHKLKDGIESKVNRKMREKDVVLAIREIESTRLDWDLDAESTREKLLEQKEQSSSEQELVAAAQEEEAQAQE